MVTWGLIALVVAGVVGFRGKGLAPAHVGMPAEVLVADSASLSDGGLPVVARLDAVAAPAQDMAVWRNLRPTESLLRGVSLLPASYPVNCIDAGQKSEGWIVGNGGVMLGYCNGVWDHFVTPVFDDLWGVQAISPTLAVAVGSAGTILHYQYNPTAHGWVWAKYPIPPTGSLLRSVSMVAQPDGSYTGWAVGHDGALVQGNFIPTTSGETFNFDWREWSGTAPTDKILADVQVLAPNNAWVVGGYDYGGAHRTQILHWNGTGWSLAYDAESYGLFGLHMRTSTDGWAVGDHGIILHYDGSTWSPVSSPTTTMLRAVHMLSASEGWAVGINGTLIRYSGGAWTLFTDLRTDPFMFESVDFTSGRGWMVGGDEAGSSGVGGVILTWDDEAWKAVTPPTNNILHSVYAVSDTDAWAVGEADELGGTILHWDGRFWERIYQTDPPIPGATLYTVHMVSSNDGWAMGAPLGTAATILHYDGSRWAPPRYQSPLNITIRSVSMLNESFGWAVGIGAKAVANYNNFNPPLSDYWEGLATCGGVTYDLYGTDIISDVNTTVNPDGYDAWAVGSGRILRFQECAEDYKWDVFSTPGDQLYAVKAVTPTLAWAVGEGVVRQFDGIDWDWGLTVSGELRAVDALPSAPELAWYVGEKGGISLILHRLPGDPAAEATIYPINGVNIGHRPLNGVNMPSTSMGWAVGEAGVIIQYPYPNFTLAVDPAYRVTTPNGVVTYDVSTVSLLGTTPVVSLTVSVEPSGTGISTVVVPATTSSGQAEITVTAVNASLGEYTIRVEGDAVIRSGDTMFPVHRATEATLFVTNNPVTQVTPDHGPAGTEVHIYGGGFGAVPAGSRSTSTDNVSIGEVPPLPDSAVESWTDDHIVICPPDSVDLWPDGPIEGVVVVTAGGLPSNATETFRLESLITQLQPSRVQEGDQVVIIGTTFGNDPPLSDRSSTLYNVTINGQQLANSHVRGWSNNSITITVPTGATSGPVVVTSNGWRSTGDPYLQIGEYEIYLPLVLRE